MNFVEEDQERVVKEITEIEKRMLNISKCASGEFLSGPGHVPLLGLYMALFYCFSK